MNVYVLTKGEKNYAVGLTRVFKTLGKAKKEARALMGFWPWVLVQKGSRHEPEWRWGKNCDYISVERKRVE